MIKEIVANMMMILNLENASVQLVDEKDLCVMYANHDTSIIRACKAESIDKRGWGPLGLTLNRNAYVAKHLDYSKLINQSIIFHELVHVKQQDESIIYPCTGHKEKDAYERQYDWLLVNGYEKSFENMLKELGINMLAYKLNISCGMF